MKLGDIRTEGNVKILLMGDAGVGKTVFATSLPGKTRLFDFDMKADSAALFYKAKPEHLANIDVDQFPPKLNISPIEQLGKIITQELIPQQQAGKMNWDTIVLDSITTFSTATLAHIVKTNPGIKRNVSAQGQQPGLQDYGILKREFQKLIPGILSLPCNVIMLAHIATEKDEATGQVLRHTMMDGSFAKELPIYFKEVWRMFVKDGKRMVQTQSDGMYNCRSQIPGLPSVLDVTEGFSAVLKYLK
jgi:phage nucleotide-binding protein